MVGHPRRAGSDDSLAADDTVAGVNTNDTVVDLEQLRERVRSLMPKVVEDLKDLTRIPSVSLGSFDQTQVARSAEAVAELLAAEGMDVKVVAEGVETQAQMDFLKANLCDEIQGYLLSPPVPAEQFAELLR